MQFVSVRIITNDIARLVEFYVQATGLEAQWLAEQFAEVASPSCTLAIGTAETMALFNPGAAVPESNRTVIIEFLVEDVDQEYERLTSLAAAPEIVQKPTTMPWGNRSLLFRDPDGNLVNFFTPATDEARARFAR
ncbi:putative enzyme related to lactoylglutathione lyase [Amycolatopsis bartoniae]|uniref:Glyoxalase n=1 Tax=Amycolatopsis bartoniae TaxID=941986 RepID=A0A8H9M908_9PSEU|nr:VOC family protein [Amycolatopsis bartoniae]MBB2934198.1 putative enzyme related to lactoylglutathione lyase [Amycolatopsis bartoniae]TVT08689.1 VOC family protein [Amycolatopsis bartoniae]GHF88505.1 glyoxalase [Amycolatopsis bartoniae]